MIRRFGKAPVLACILLAAPMSAQASEVSLSGQASVSYAPDSVRLKFTASAENKSPEAAAQEVSEKVQQFRRSVDRYRDDLENYSDDTLSRYTRSRPAPNRQQPPIEMAVASQTISFSTSNLDLLNPILSEVQSLDLDYRLNPNQFFHSQEEEFRKQALKGAIKDARERCEFVANELGKKCGEVVTMSVNDGLTPRPMMAEARSTSMMAVENVGDREVQATVNATFTMK